MREFQYLAPKTLEEAVSLLSEHRGKMVVLNGGTDIVVQLREGLIAPDYVLDIKGIATLHKITFTQAEGLVIGACAVMNDIAAHPAVQAHWPFLADAAHSVGSGQVRNRATCVGNLVNASPLADTATPLLACDAVVMCVGPQGAREIPLCEFFVFVRRTTLAPDEIVTGIRVPYLPELRGAFTKISRRRKVDLSTVCGTVARCGTAYRIAFGSVAPTPLRLPRTEHLLESGPLSPELIDAAVAMAKGEVAPIDDVRARKEHRLDMVEAILRRSLRSLNAPQEVTA